MKIFFVDQGSSPLANGESRVMPRVRLEMLKFPEIKEAFEPGEADALVIHEKFSYKDFRYISTLTKDPLLSRFYEKTFTINNDDAATGLLPGLYTSLPKSRFDPTLHVAVPYIEFPNDLVFSGNHEASNPRYLASWRGNTKSNALRRRMVESLGARHAFCLETTKSWMNHKADEKASYVEVMMNAKFSLCPAGWAPVSFRIYESMAVGRCPVILADQLVLPSGPDWSSCALFFAEKELSHLEDYLRKHEYRYRELGAKAKAEFDSYFADAVVAEYYAKKLIALIFSARQTSREAEIRRWNSLLFFWKNKWTVPQRVLNKARKWTARVADVAAIK